MKKEIKKIVIVGGGFGGWYTAATFQYRFKNIEIVVVDSSAHGILGVGEATGPDAPLNFQRLCGIDSSSQEFMYNTGAIIKLGARNINFFSDNTSHFAGKFHNLKISALSNFYNGFDFHEFDEPWNRDPSDPGLVKSWLSLYGKTKTLDDLALEVGETTHFLKNPVAPFNKQNNLILRSALGQVHGYHIDAEYTGTYLKNVVFNRNHSGQVKHVNSTVLDIHKDSTGIKYLKLENGTRLSADLYIDATGFKRVLMTKGLNNSWKSYNEFVNSAWVCQATYNDPESEMIGAIEFHGEDYGWRFLINLYHRTGNGYLFDSNLVDKSVPLQRLNEVTQGRQIKQPRLLQWQPGEFIEPWQQNVIPLGLAAGFLDPHHAYTFDAHSRSLEDLVSLLSDMVYDESTIKEYNKRRSYTMEERRLRLILGHGVSRRSGKFWESRRNIFQENNGLQKLQDIITEKRLDLESRMNWFWHHLYITPALASRVDMSDWDFAPVPEKYKTMLDAFFKYNKQRNIFIRQQPWPNYYRWLQENIYNGETNQDVLDRIQSTVRNLAH